MERLGGGFEPTGRAFGDQLSPLFNRFRLSRRKLVSSYLVNKDHSVSRISTSSGIRRHQELIP